MVVFLPAARYRRKPVSCEPPFEAGALHSTVMPFAPAVTERNAGAPGTVGVTSVVVVSTVPAALPRPAAPKRPARSSVTIATARMHENVGLARTLVNASGRS